MWKIFAVKKPSISLMALVTEAIRDSVGPLIDMVLYRLRNGYASLFLTNQLLYQTILVDALCLPFLDVVSLEQKKSSM